jgi:hypothetical protein
MLSIQASVVSRQFEKLIFEEVLQPMYEMRALYCVITGYIQHRQRHYTKMRKINTGI